MCTDQVTEQLRPLQTPPKAPLVLRRRAKLCHRAQAALCNSSWSVAGVQEHLAPGSGSGAQVLVLAQGAQVLPLAADNIQRQREPRGGE